VAYQATYAYDANRNLTQRTLGAGQQGAGSQAYAYAYDFANRLLSLHALWGRGGSQRPLPRVASSTVHRDSQHRWRDRTRRAAAQVLDADPGPSPVEAAIVRRSPPGWPGAKMGQVKPRCAPGADCE
jgi:hypothetical protein